MKFETQLVIYPGQRHSITMPGYVRPRLTRDVTWWDAHLTEE